MTAALQSSALSKRYRNQVEALKGVDLEVPAGSFFGILGPNGAGKSTFIGIVCSLVQPSSGSVRIFGHDLATDPEQARAQIGLVPQEFNFNQFEPVEEIVLNQGGYYGISRRRAYPRVKALLKELDLWEKRRAESRSLSGGMKRRLMIARALVHSPRLLILDEPTAGVDIEIRRSMWDFMRTMNLAGTTIILTTHYLEEAESLCDHIAIIDRGRIVELANVAGLLARLRSETFILNLTQPVTSLPELPGSRLRQIDPCTLEICVERGQTLNQLFFRLGEADIHVQSLRNKQNRLEQLFLEMKQQPAAGGEGG